MEKELLQHLKKGFGPAPRTLKQFSPNELIYSLPTDWSWDEELAYLFKGQEALWKEGRITLGYTLKAYFEIYGPGDSNHLGMVLFSLSDDDDAILKELPAVYERLSSQRGMEDSDWNDEERRFMAAFHDDYTPCRGLAVPQRFSPLLPCFIADFFYHRNFMPVESLRRGWLPLVTAVSPFPRAQLIGEKFWTKPFIQEWEKAVKDRIQANASSNQRIRLAAKLESKLRAGPAIRADPTIPAKDLEGYWLYDTESKFRDHGTDLQTFHIRQRWQFLADGYAQATFEMRPLSNGAPADWASSSIENYEGTYSLNSGILKVNLKDHPDSPFEWTVIGSHELALNQTIRLRGPYFMPALSNTQDRHVPPPLPASEHSLPQPPPLNLSPGEKTPRIEPLLIEIFFVSLEIPPGYQDFIERELKQSLHEKGLGTVMGSGSGLGFCDLVVETSPPMYQQALDTIRNVLISNDAPKSTRIACEDKEFPLEPTPPPPLPYTSGSVAKGAWASIGWGLASLFTIILPILLPFNILAWLSGRKVLKQVQESGGQVKGRGLAWTGIILGSLSLVGMLIYWTMAVTSFMTWLEKNSSKHLAQEPGYAAAQIAEKSTRMFTRGGSGNTAKAREIAESIVQALLSLQRESLPTGRPDLLRESEPSVYVHVSSEKVAVILSFNFAFSKLKPDSAKEFHAATWTFVHALVSLAKVIPPESPIALGIQNSGNYQAMFFGQTTEQTLVPENLVTPPHEREINSGAVLQNKKRLYSFFDP